MTGKNFGLDRRITGRTTYEAFMKVVENPYPFDRTFKQIHLAENETIVCMQGEYFKYNTSTQSFSKLQLVAAAGCSKSDAARRASMRNSKIPHHLSCIEENGDRIKMLYFRNTAMYR